MRSISFFEVNAVEGCRWGGRQLFELHLRGSAFLWHQVRCMAAVLLLVGEGREAPEVVRRYLDVTAEPLKPQYSMASEVRARKCRPAPHRTAPDGAVTARLA